MQITATEATKAAHYSPELSRDNDNSFPFDHLDASLAGQKKMAEEWKSVLAPRKEKKRKSIAVEVGVGDEGGGAKVNGEGGMAGSSSKKNKNKKKRKGGSFGNGNGAGEDGGAYVVGDDKRGGEMKIPDIQELSGGVNRATEKKDGESKGFGNEGSLNGGEMRDDIGTQIDGLISSYAAHIPADHPDEPLQKVDGEVHLSRSQRKKARKLQRERELREQEGLEVSLAKDVGAEDFVMSVAGADTETNHHANADNRVTGGHGQDGGHEVQGNGRKKQKRKREEPSLTVIADDSIIGYGGDVEVDEGESKKRRKKSKKGKKEKEPIQESRSQAKEVENNERVEVTSISSTKNKKAHEDQGESFVREETPSPTPKKRTDKEPAAIVPSTPITKRLNEYDQNHVKEDGKKQIPSSEARKIKAEHSQESALLLHSLPKQSREADVNGETAPASTLHDKSTKIHGKGHNNNLAIPAPLPRTSYPPSDEESDDNSAKQSKEKEKTSQIATHQMDADIIRQKQWASQKDELRNTILRAKNASAAIYAAKEPIEMSQAAGAVQDSSADEGPLAKMGPRPKESPIPPPPQRKQLISQPTTRLALPPPDHKMPLKARAVSPKGNNALSKAVSNLRKDSLGKISPKKFSDSSPNIKSENGSGPSRRVITSSKLVDLAGEKLVLVEEPNWEASAGKVRARIGGDDAEGEESV